MNAKELTQLNPDKKGLRSKTENGETEVFVLPPDLLQKLGIQLSGVQTLPEPPADTPPSGFTNSSNIRKSNETILETAELMKQSVFLSPTFIPTVSNIPGEVEVAHIGDENEETVIDQEIRPEDAKLTNLESNTLDPVLVDINESVLDIISCERNHDTENGQNLVYGESSYINTMSLSDSTKLLHNGDFKMITSCEHFKTSKKSTFKCNPTENAEESNIKQSVKQREEDNVNKENNHIHENTSKVVISTEPLLDTNSSSINEKVYPISLINCLITKENKVPVNISITSEEILDCSKLMDVKSLNSSTIATFIPMVMKTDINGRKNPENNFIENVDKSYLKFKVNEKVENSQEISDDSPKSKLPINISLANVKRGPQINSSNNIISPIEYKEAVTPDIDNKNSDCVSSKETIIDTKMSKTNIEKDTILNFDPNLCRNKILNGNDSYLFETQNVDKENEDVKKYFDNGYDDSFDITSVCQKVDKSVELECKPTEINIHCFKYQNSNEREAHNKNQQKIDESACTRSNDPTLHNSKYCESTTTLNTFSELFLNDVDISNCKLSEMNNHSTELNDHVIEDDKVIKNVFPPVIMKEFTTNLDTCSLNSKSCIQGVEKPGGDFNYDKPKVLKTYKRRNKFRTLIKKTSDCVEPKNILNIPVFTEQNINYVNTTDVIQTQEFCICHDFGQLNFYENDSVYEHIHFWKHNISTENSQLIYSCDKADDKYFDTLEEKQSDDSYLSQCNSICWNNCEIHIEEHITKLDFDIDNVHIPKYSDTNEITKVFKNPKLYDCYVAVGKGDEINIDKDCTENLIKNKKSSETILMKCNNNSNNCSKNQNTHTDIDCRENPINYSNDERRNLTIYECDTGMLEFSIGNNKLTTDKTIKCGVCMEELSEIKWENHISNVHSYIAWKAGDTIDLDDTGLLNKLSKKLNSEGILECTFCETKFKEVNLLILHLITCMESFKSNVVSSKVRKYTKCGVCQNNVDTTKWIRHIAEEHNYMAWNAIDCILDLQNQSEVENHLYNISKQYNGLICSKCKVIYVHVKVYLEHIKKCDGTEDLMKNNSNNDTSNLKTSLKINVSEEKFGSKKKIQDVCQSANDVKTKDVDIEILEKDITVTVETSSHMTTVNKTNIQKELLKHKKNKFHAGPEVANINVKDNKFSQIEENDNRDDEHLTEVAHLGISESLVSNATSQLPRRVQNKMLNKKTESASNKIKASTDKITFKETCSTSGLNANKHTTYNKEITISKCDDTEAKDTMNIKESTHTSNEDNSLSSNVIAIEIPKNKRNTCDKGLCVTSSKRKSGSISEVSILTSKEDVELTTPTKKKKKVLEPTSLSKKTLNVKCGVCLQEVTSSSWFDHISKEHNYLAWMDGTPSIDLKEEYEVEQHLKKILKQHGELLCMKCGCKRKYVKPYMYHIKSCDISPNHDNQLNDSAIDYDISKTDDNLNNISVNESSDERDISCGVCHEEMKSRDWLNHIQKSHSYIAWIEGEKALDTNDAEELQKYLMSICKRIGGLKCSKCGLVRKYVKTFLQHVRSCERASTNVDDSDTSLIENNASLVQCGVCSDEMEKNKWEHHAMSKHSNVAWIIGDPSIEPLRNTSTNSLNTYFETHVTKERLQNQKKTEKVNSESADHIVELADSVINTGSTTSYEMQKTNSKNNSKSVIKDIKKDGFTKQCDKSRLNSQKHTSNNKEVSDNKCYDIEINATIKTEEPTHSSNEDNSISSNITSVETPKNQANNFNKEQSVKQCKRKSDGITEASISTSNKDVESTISTKKKDLQSTTLSKEMSNIDTQNVKCGVCLQDIASSSWFDHISKEHNYLTWKDGTPAVDLSEEYEVEQHLRKMLKEYGELFCMKCGCKRKYVKPYMYHIKTCKSLPNDDTELNDSTIDNNINRTDDDLNTVFSTESSDYHDIKCGVCQQEMKQRDWLNHIQKSHNYMAWIEGDEAFDTNDAEEVQKRLMSICKRIGGLTCSKCGLVRKYVKAFLQHVRSCKRATTNTDDSDTSLIKNEAGIVQCGVCSKELERNMWENHAMKEHYNVAWILGDPPIDLRSFYAVDKYLKEYKNKYHKLVCKVCQISRVSCYGFYAHILFCGKPEEEAEKYKDLCEICNNKYICIYKHQHMAMHREQEYAKERKLKLAEEKNKEKGESGTSSADTPGRRRAAEKAKIVIAKYKTNLNEGNGSCKRCGFEGDNAAGLTQHNCSEVNNECPSDSDKSVKLDQYSEDESIDSDVDSNVSNEEIQVEKKKKKHGDHSSSGAKVPRLPYSVKHVESYLRESYADFCKMHLTSETLFPKWRRNDYVVVSDVEIPNYTPPLKESCKTKFIDDEWKSYSLFQASTRRENDIVFVGGTIQCIAWAPSRLDDVEDIGENYLAVGCHTDNDCPRYNYDEIFHHPNLIQIWNFGNTAAPTSKYEFGIAHDYGTVWAMDWCPSGARDLLESKSENTDSDNTFNRLGLLAIACSNGTAYIFSVPYPSAIMQKEQSFYKIKPVAELRLSRREVKRKCQATSLSWSSRKRHSNIIVGYSDGTIALYDLESDSPLLTTIEDDVSILYPYHDERYHNTCITDVGSYAVGTDVGSGQAWSSSSCSGARAVTGLPGRAAAVHTHLASTGAAFTPHWPSVQLTGDSYISSMNQTVNELEWVGGGRRVGGARSWCACARCGLAAATTPPLIRVQHAHPAYTEIKKQIIGLLEMSPIGQKRKQCNDELAIKLEPFNYEDAIKKYGLEFKTVPGKNKKAQQKAALIPATAYPERYPLADVTCMAFCTSAKWHNKLAIATHAGIILFLDI